MTAVIDGVEEKVYKIRPEEIPNIIKTFPGAGFIWLDHPKKFTATINRAKRKVRVFNTDEGTFGIGLEGYTKEDTIIIAIFAKHFNSWPTDAGKMPPAYVEDTFTHGAFWD